MRISILAILICLSASTLWAQKATLKLNRSSLYVGDSVSIELSISGIDSAQSMNFNKSPDIKLLQINWNNPSVRRSTNIINGHVSKTVQLSFQGKAIKVGKGKIGPLRFNLNGKSYTSNSTSFEVLKPQSGGITFKAKMSTGTQKIYPNQLLPLTIDLWIQDQIIHRIEQQIGQRYDLSNHYQAIQFPKSFTDQFKVHPGKMTKTSDQGGYYGTLIDPISENGVRYRRHRLEFKILATTPKIDKIPSLDIIFHTISIRRTRGFFASNQAVTGPPQLVTLKALPLSFSEIPTQNRPPSFSGLVLDRLSIKQVVQDLIPNSEVRIHTPLSIQLSFESNLPPQLMAFPGWSQQSQITQSFQPSNHEPLREEFETQVLFKDITLRPTDPKATEIPPFQIHYFNPSTEKFEIAKGQSFPLTIVGSSKVENLNEQPQEILDLPQEKKQAKSIGLETPIFASDQIFASNNTFKYQPILITLGCGIWALLFLKIGWGFISNRSKQQTQDLRHQIKKIVKQLKAEKDPKNCREYLATYLQLRFSIQDPFSLKLQDEALRLKTLQSLETLEYSSFSGQEHSSDDVIQQLPDLIDQLEKATIA